MAHRTNRAQSKVSIDPGPSPFFPYRVQNLAFGDLRCYRGHGRHHVLKRYTRQLEAPVASDGAGSSGSGLPADSIFAEKVPSRYRGLPIPVEVAQQFRDASVWGYPAGVFPSLWCMGLDDGYEPSLLVMFPARWRSQSGLKHILETDIEYLNQVVDREPDLQLEVLHMYYLLVARQKKEELLGPELRYFLPVPEVLVAPSQRERFLLEQDPRFGKNHCPDRVAFTLVYMVQGILLYMRHSLVNPLVDSRLPDFLVPVRGGDWVGYSKEKDIRIAMGGTRAGPTSTRLPKPGRP